MVETVIAVLIISLCFFTLFRLSRMLEAKILLEHAAMRVARARAVGCNEFQCLKVARIAVIPVAGERLKPDKDDTREGIDELAMARMYLRTPDTSYADGLLIYDHWRDLEVRPGTGSGASETELRTSWFDLCGEESACGAGSSGCFTLRGEAVVDSFPEYMVDGGL